MLRKDLYYLCNFICSPYSSNIPSSSIQPLITDNILEKLNSRVNFKFIWNKKNNLIINNFKFSFRYIILEQSQTFIKLKLSIESSFSIPSNFNNIKSGCIDEYLIIIEYSHSHNKIHELISKEEDPLLYYNLMYKNLDFILSLSPIFTDDIWDSNLNSINDLYNKIQSLSYHFFNRKVNSNSSFNLKNACEYAETYALTPNPSYTCFDNIGGDCTNFASQIIHAGGINTNPSWKPYSNSWLRVEELYSYLLYNKLGIKITNDNFLAQGCLIQFNTPKLGRYFHTGFITHKLASGECLYCCHSYNKLNYPLSQIYPVLYPIIRGLSFY